VLRQDKLNPCLIAIERARQLLTTPSLATGVGRKNMSLILRKNIEKSGVRIEKAPQKSGYGAINTALWKNHQRSCASSAKKK